MDKKESNENEIRRETIGLYLKTSREVVGLTQDQLASLLGYSSSQVIANWENGFSQPPVDIFPKLVVALHIQENSLLKIIMDCQEQLQNLRRSRLRNNILG